MAYIDRMQKLDLEVASDFLLVASTLLDIKAASLIPSEKTEVEDELEELSPNEAREILIEKLIAYKQYKNAAWAPEKSLRTRRAHASASLWPLTRNFWELCPIIWSRPRSIRSRFCAPRSWLGARYFCLKASISQRNPFPWKRMCAQSIGRISTRAHLMFSELLEAAPTLQLRVVNFLAILELYKRGMVSLEQSGSFADIPHRLYRRQRRACLHRI